MPPQLHYPPPRPPSSRLQPSLCKGPASPPYTGARQPEMVVVVVVVMVILMMMVMVMAMLMVMVMVMVMVTCILSLDIDEGMLSSQNWAETTVVNWTQPCWSVVFNIFDHHLQCIWCSWQKWWWWWCWWWWWECTPAIERGVDCVTSSQRARDPAADIEQRSCQ